MTMNEVKNEVMSFYSGYLTDSKALKLYEIEYGNIPEIEPEPEPDFYIGYDSLKSEGLIPDGVTKEHLVWMKNIQETGQVNMIVGPIRRMIEQNFLVDREIASDIHKTYLNYYSHLYHPEDLL